MANEGKNYSKLAGLGCGGAFVGAFVVGNLVEDLGRGQLEPDDRASLAYAYYLGAPLGAYIGIRIIPIIAAAWKKFRDTKRPPPAL